MRVEPGKKFGKLTIISEAEYIKNTRVKWLCQCDCGNSKIASARELKSGDTKSCGCLSKSLFLIKAQQMRIAKTKYTPEIAAAHYIWRRHYKQRRIKSDNFFGL